MTMPIKVLAIALASTVAIVLAGALYFTVRALAREHPAVRQRLIGVFSGLFARAWQPNVQSRTFRPSTAVRYSGPLYPYEACQVGTRFGI